jgi:hypothetical protein
VTSIEIHGGRSGTEAAFCPICSVLLLVISLPLPHTPSTTNHTDNPSHPVVFI